MDYGRLAATAERLLHTYGVAMTLTKVTQGAYDPVDGAAVSSSSKSYIGYGVRDAYRTSEIDGTRIRQSDVRIYLRLTTDATPAKGDALATADGQKWSVENTEIIKPGDTVILYTVQARAA